MALNDRKSWVLKSVVDTYVETAEPVASKTIADLSTTQVSSATIRNEMAELEKQGYLVSPHTSAGRVPTDKAYREYVEHLMRPVALDEEEKGNIRRELGQEIYELSDLLKQAGQVLSTSTGYTSIALMPSENERYIKQIKLLQIEPGRILIVLVFSAGVLKDRVIRAHEYLTQYDLIQISNALEDNLSGVPVEDITLMTVESALDQVELPDALLNQLLYEAYVTIKQSEQLDVYVEGVQNLFIQPDLRENDKAHLVYDALKKDGLITGYLKDQDNQEGNFMIRIGQEIKLDGLEACSLITTSYKIGDKLKGQIGILGPKRMDYERAIPRIAFIRERVSDFRKEDKK